jgi:DNA-directed RNA polymerase subunit RPC12/RpoP
MTIDFTCQKCEASFELDAQDLIDGTEKLACPHCGNKAPTNMVEDFTSALTEMRAQVATLLKKFAVSMSIESEDLEEELEAEEEDDDEEDDELDFDEDDEDGDEDEYEEEDTEER